MLVLVLGYALVKHANDAMSACSVPSPRSIPNCNLTSESKKTPGHYCDLSRFFFDSDVM